MTINPITTVFLHHHLFGSYQDVFGVEMQNE